MINKTEEEYEALISALLKERELLEKEVQRKNARIEIQEYILSNLGIDSKIIDQIEEKLIELQDKYGNDKTMSEDEIANVIEDELAKFYHDLSFLNDTESYLYYEDLLKNSFENTWKKLSNETKECLITAKITYQSLNKLNYSKSLDYSGACLLVTKALEMELFKIYYQRYMNYLNKRYNRKYEYYPEAMLNEKNNNILMETNFTMGTVKYITGSYYDKRHKSYKFNIDKSQTFLNYANEILYVGYPIDEIKKETIKNVTFIERTRNDFRNPAAHRNHLSKVTCEECLNYIIDVEKRMKKMLENMDI